MRRDPKRTQLAVEGILSVLLLISIGMLFVLLFGPLWLASSSRLPLPPVEQPEKVGALVAKLKTGRLLRELDPKPTSCGHVPKGRRRDRCSYRAGDMVVTVVWARDSVRRISVTIWKTEPRGSVSFAWADLPDTIRLLCDIDSKSANAVAQEMQAELDSTPWYRGEDRVTADTDGAWRRIPGDPEAACPFDMQESVTGSTVSARLEIQRVSAD